MRRNCGAAPCSRSATSPRSAICRSERVLQHRHPLPRRVTSSVLPRRSASSMPTLPNSLMTTAVPSPSAVVRKRRTSVVFLGAGKTTLVRRFLTTAEGEGTAVVINEFGSVGIDDALLRGSTDEVTLLGNGCLCCNTRSDLQNALRNLVAERNQGRVPQFRRILIETSGLADPGPILQTFATDRALGGEFHVEVLVAMVDAVAGLDTLEWSAEARKQIILADRLVVCRRAGIALRLC